MGFFSNFGGNLISGGLGLLGGVLSDRSAGKAQSSSDAQNYAMQKEFAQHGIRWKMADAKAAGIHPMYAMGATGASANASFGTPDQSGTGRALSQAGSQIGKTMQNTELNDLQKSLIRSQINETDAQTRNTNARTTSLGQPQSPQIDNVPPGTVANIPSEVTSSSLDNSSVQAGVINSMQFMDSGEGLTPVMSKDSKERLEEDTSGSWSWQFQNRIAPKISPGYAKLQHYFPGAEKWKWNMLKFMWTPVYPRKNASKRSGYTHRPQLN